MAVYQKRSDHGVHLPHGIVQHSAGAGLGLSEIDKGNIGQHRTIWQEAPAWIFGSIQSLENEGILYVPARGMPHP